MLVSNLASLFVGGGGHLKRRENTEGQKALFAMDIFFANFNTTSQIDISNGGQSPELIGVGCEVKVRIWGQITD